MAGGCGHASVARHQRRVERLGERNIGGVIGRQIVPQLPNSRQQEIVRVAAQREIRKVVEREAAAFAVDLAVRSIASDHLCDFDIEQVRRVKRLTGAEQPGFDRVRVRGSQENLEQRRGVDDDHARSRSARTASAGGTEGATCVLLRKRARNSSSVGRSATRRISSSR